MNRMISTLTVLTMTLFAVALSMRQTLQLGDTFGRNETMAMLAVETIFGAIIIAGCAGLLRKKYFGKRVISRPKRFEAVQQLRRLLAAVWS